MYTVCISFTHNRCSKGERKQQAHGWYPQQKSQSIQKLYVSDSHFAIQWSIPIESMHGIFTYVCRQTYQCHGSYGTYG